MMIKLVEFQQLYDGLLYTYFTLIFSFVFLLSLSICFFNHHVFFFILLLSASFISLSLCHLPISRLFTLSLSLCHLSIT